MKYEDSIDFEEKNHEDLMEKFSDKYRELYNIFVEEVFAQDGMVDEDALYEQSIEEKAIEEFKDKVDWGYISIYQKLSEDFIREFKYKVDWDYISEYQKLSQDFIREFKDKVDWGYISVNQKLSEDFIREFKNKVNRYCISKYQKLSEDFIREFKLKIDKDNWLYKNEEFKKEQIVKSKKYECFKNYFYAYKGVRSDRFSNFNFQYKYLDNKTYESNADFTDEENSFGLSCWTFKEAKNYCNQCILKVKVYYKDVARIIHSNNKIRVTKLKIIGEVKK